MWMEIKRLTSKMKLVLSVKVALILLSPNFVLAFVFFHVIVFCKTLRLNEYSFILDLSILFCSFVLSFSRFLYEFNFGTRFDTSLWEKWYGRLSSFSIS